MTDIEVVSKPDTSRTCANCHIDLSATRNKVPHKRGGHLLNLWEPSLEIYESHS